MACSATTDYTLYETFDIKLGVDGYLEAQIILWVILFIPALLIAIGISCGFAKISDKLFCIPLIDKKTVKFDEFHLEDTKAFKGILPKLTSAVKAITLSGIALSMANVYGLQSEYQPCKANDPVAIIVIVIQVVALLLYVMIWRIDISYGVIAGNIPKKIIWFIAARIISLIIGACFIRFIVIDSTNYDDNCYCFAFGAGGDVGADGEASASAGSVSGIEFVGYYFASLPVLWVLGKLQAPKLIAMILSYIYSQYILCNSSNCCIEVEVETKEPGGAVGKGGKAAYKKTKQGVTKVISFTTQFAVQITGTVLGIIVPSVALYFMFDEIAAKWEPPSLNVGANVDVDADVEAEKTSLDITDVVFIWILFEAATFFMIAFMIRCKRKYFPAPEKKPEVDKYVIVIQRTVIDDVKNEDDMKMDENAKPEVNKIITVSRVTKRMKSKKSMKKKETAIRKRTESRVKAAMKESNAIIKAKAKEEEMDIAEPEIVELEVKENEPLDELVNDTRNEVDDRNNDKGEDEEKVEEIPVEIENEDKTEIIVPDANDPEEENIEDIEDVEDAVNTTQPKQRAGTTDSTEL